MAFRIGRKYARHFYPERTGGGGASLPFVRNFAIGPDQATALSVSGVSVPWFPDIGDPGPTPNVPITPAVTGVILISAVVSLKNAAGAPATIKIQGKVDSDVLDEPETEQVTIPASGFAVMSFLMETTATVGVQHNVQIIVTGPVTVSIALGSSSIDVQEVSASSG